MNVTEQLLRLHRVDKQLRGLRNRIDSAQRYLAQQERLLKELTARREATSSQIRQLEATVHNEETDIAHHDERIETLREQLNNAQTSKEYSAFLSEINTHKADKALIEDRVLELMSQLEELKKSLSDLEGDFQERSGICEVARNELQRRKKDAQDRLDELEIERKHAASEVPQDALQVFDEIAQRIDSDDDVMAPLEEHSRKAMEYACGACQTMVPVELVSRLLGKGQLTRCDSCGCILYLEASLKEAMSTSKK